MKNKMNPLDYLTPAEQLDLIESSRYVATITDNDSGYMSDLYLIYFENYVEAVYSLTENPKNIAFLRQVNNERLKMFGVEPIQPLN